MIAHAEVHESTESCSAATADVHLAILPNGFLHVLADKIKITAN
jgi:hypothetical protein